MVASRCGMRPSSETQDAVPEGWLGWSRGRAGGPPEPRLRLLYHSDIERFGAITLPGVIPGDGSWLTLGRNDPDFANAVPPSVRPLGDPNISREQLRVRWLRDAGRFELEPAGGARRPLHLVELGARGATHQLSSRVQLEPGACVAIGDRALIGLEVASVHPPADSRMGLVGETEALWALREEIRSIAQFGRSALVNGPTGAGKELVARALHQQSPRAAGPFVPVNCAALPENLVESALFGHRKGAFTGADTEEKGLFRAAEGGTLFFDELGELPLSVQPKLLRVLQDGIVTPVGAHHGRPVDVRVVAATHRDLEAQVRRGELREDLYHRVAAHVVRVPSLAERRFDIPELLSHLLGRLRAEHPGLGWLWARGQEWRPALPIGFLVELLRQEFRGNVRELQNLVERTARLNLESGVFRGPEPPEASTALSVPAPAPEALEPAESAALKPVEEAMVRRACEALGLARKTLLKLVTPAMLGSLAAEAEKEGFSEVEAEARLRARAAEALLTLLQARDYNQSSVAASLGASRTTLIKLMDDLGLPRAADLSLEDIDRARQQVGGDLDAAARLLKVSPAALKKRVTLLNLKASG